MIAGPRGWRLVLAARQLSSPSRDRTGRPNFFCESVATGYSRGRFDGLGPGCELN